ncbi:MAG: hypothetical protein JKX76_02360 [Colwellia sp.]|nr:hypothetical protein [Colwellia sp.]
MNIEKTSDSASKLYTSLQDNMIHMKYKTSAACDHFVEDLNNLFGKNPSFAYSVVPTSDPSEARLEQSFDPSEARLEQSSNPDIGANNYSSHIKQIALARKKRNQTQEMILKYPNRVLVKIITHGNIPKPTKNKFIVSKNNLFGQFLWLIRTKHLIYSKNSLNNASKTIYSLVNGCMISPGDSMANVYQTHKSPDDILHIHLYEENIFG